MVSTVRQNFVSLIRKKNQFESSNWHLFNTSLQLKNLISHPNTISYQRYRLSQRSTRNHTLFQKIIERFIFLVSDFIYERCRCFRSNPISRKVEKVGSEKHVFSTSFTSKIHILVDKIFLSQSFNDVLLIKYSINFFFIKSIRMCN